MTGHFARTVADQREAVRFGSARGGVRAGLRLPEQEAAADLALPDAAGPARPKGSTR